MDRRGFLGKLAAAAIGVALAPALKLVSEPETICTSGLLHQIQQSGNTYTFSTLDMAMFDELVAALDNQYGPDEAIDYAGVASFYSTVMGIEAKYKAKG